MKRLALAALLISIFTLGVWVQLKSSAPVEWEHGWKTDRVTATRYKSAIVGYNIGFTFPNNPNDCDREELFDFMQKKNQGAVYQAGGYPGAEMFVVFRDVKDKESANRKLRAILPALDKLVRSL